MRLNLLAIDPGNVQSAFALMDTETYKPSDAGIFLNDDFIRWIKLHGHQIDRIACEIVKSYGMAVGETVFETCEMVGRITQVGHDLEIPVTRIPRIEEKLTICHDSRAKDSNIRRALIDRFAQHDKARGVGTKDNPDWFRHFKRDIWAAYAVGVTWIDKEKERKNDG